MRSSYIASGEPGCSTAGFRMSPASPPVQHTSTLCTPSAAYFAVVPAPFDASSSGWACTWSRHSRSVRHRGHATRLRSSAKTSTAPMLRTCWTPRATQRTSSPGRRPSSSRSAAGHQHLARARELGEAAREVDDRSEVVAVARHDGSGGEPDPQRRQPAAAAAASRSASDARDASRGRARRTSPRHRSSSRPRAVRRDRVVRDRLPSADEMAVRVDPDARQLSCSRRGRRSRRRPRTSGSAASTIRRHTAARSCSRCT